MEKNVVLVKRCSDLIPTKDIAGVEPLGNAFAFVSFLVRLGTLSARRDDAVSVVTSEVDSLIDFVAVLPLLLQRRVCKGMGNGTSAT